MGGQRIGRFNLVRTGFSIVKKGCFAREVLYRLKGAGNHDADLLRIPRKVFREGFFGD